MTKGITTSISASSKLSVQLKGVYYTMEYSETRSVPEDCNLEEERKALWDTVNLEVDNQVMEIKQLLSHD